jgi:hypothetical protein
MAGGGGCARARRGFYPFYRQPARGRAFLGHIAAPEEEGFGLGALDGDGDGEVAAPEASALRGRSGRSLARGGVGSEELGHDAWKATASRRWPAVLLSGGGAALRRRQRNREGERREKIPGLFCNF